MDINTLSGPEKVLYKYTVDFYLKNTKLTLAEAQAKAEQKVISKRKLSSILKYKY